jgi:hypothetical protein
MVVPFSVIVLAPQFSVFALATPNEAKTRKEKPPFYVASSAPFLFNVLTLGI